MKVLNEAIYAAASALPTVLFCVSGGKLMLPLAVTVFIHETAHLLVLKLLNGKIKGFYAAPFGLRLEIDQSTLSLGGEAAVSMAGSAANLITAAICVILQAAFDLDLSDLGMISLAVAVINLIPAEPLDGGRTVVLLLSVLLDPFRAVRITAVFSCTVAISVFAFSSYALLTSGQGLYLLLFSLYVFLCASARLCEK